MKASSVCDSSSFVKLREPCTHLLEPACAPALKLQRKRPAGMKETKNHDENKKQQSALLVFKNGTYIQIYCYMKI